MTAVELLRIEIIVFIAGSAIAVFWKLVTGAIVMRGLLTDKITGQFSATRLQLLLGTLMGAAFYASKFSGSHGEFPEPGLELLAIVGGSNAIYLGTKSWSLFKLIQSLRS